MNANTTTAGKQSLKGAFIVFIEHSKNTFMCAVDLFVCTFINTTHRPAGTGGGGRRALLHSHNHCGYIKNKGATSEYFWGW